MAAEETGAKKKTDYLTPALAIGGGLLGLFVFAHIAALAVFAGVMAFIGTAVVGLVGAALGVIGGVRAGEAIKDRIEHKGSQHSGIHIPGLDKVKEKIAEHRAGRISEITSDLGDVGGRGMFHHAITGLSNSAFARSVRERLHSQSQSQGVSQEVSGREI